MEDKERGSNPMTMEVGRKDQAIASGKVQRPSSTAQHTASTHAQTAASAGHESNEIR